MVTVGDNDRMATRLLCDNMRLQLANGMIEYKLETVSH